MNLEEYKKQYKQDQAVGALAIEERLKLVYGDLEPRFYSPQTMSFQGGEDPIDGVAVYDVNGYHHLISYGMSHLYYNEQAVGEEFSKWGFELTFRVKPFDGDEGQDPFWVIQLMNNLARFVEETKVWFNEYQFLPLGGPIRSDAETDIVGIAFVKDVDLDEMETPHGKVIFLQMVGLNVEQLKRLENNSTTEEVKALLNDIQSSNPKFICEL
ncbi:suppressor of fused domain protein [Faecalibacter sp. LW9]|uniref:suppressor of fused domain protein n=1 Tax=Faecalibacter sp. LW9 TaxID=3103144 RepID=UPI002AFDD2FA|nr:suppressor of fused domain protein [Faecalibacter sp. LW9]